MTAEQYIADILIREGNGKYTDDPKDSGGPTRWGITEMVARAYGYRGRMDELPRDWAFNIYLKRYWEEPGFNLINEVFPSLAERLLDFGVISGPMTSAKQLQRVLNVLNRNGRDYSDIPADGRVGTLTISALRALLAKRGYEGKMVILGAVSSLQSVYLLELAEHRPKDEEYEFGWQLNRSIGAVMGKNYE